MLWFTTAWPLPVHVQNFSDWSLSHPQTRIIIIHHRQGVKQTYASAMQRARVRSFFGPLVGLFGFGLLTLLLWYGGRQVVQGVLTPGELIAFVFYMLLLIGPLDDFAGLYGRLREAMGAEASGCLSCWIRPRSHTRRRPTPRCCPRFRVGCASSRLALAMNGRRRMLRLAYNPIMTSPRTKAIQPHCQS